MTTLASYDAIPSFTEYRRYPTEHFWTCKRSMATKEIHRLLHSTKYTSVGVTCRREQDGNKTKEINHWGSQSNGRNRTQQGRPRIVSEEAQQSTGRGWCVYKTDGLERRTTPALSVRLVGLFIRCPCVFPISCLFLLAGGALHEALALIAFFAGTVDGVNTLFL